jgi:hypothetical protein
VRTHEAQLPPTSQALIFSLLLLLDSLPAGPSSDYPIEASLIWWVIPLCRPALVANDTDTSTGYTCA